MYCLQKKYLRQSDSESQIVLNSQKYLSNGGIPGAVAFGRGRYFWTKRSQPLKSSQCGCQLIGPALCASVFALDCWASEGQGLCCLFNSRHFREVPRGDTHFDVDGTDEWVVGTLALASAWGSICGVDTTQEVMATVLGLEGAVAYLHAFVFNVSGLPEVPYVLQFFFFLWSVIYLKDGENGGKREILHLLIHPCNVSQ